MTSARSTPGLCARFHEAVELIGARWTGAILQVLMQGQKRYADLRAAVPDISDRMLCERLRELEKAGIVERTVSADPPVRVDYALTEKGKGLEPSLDAISRWAARWVPLESTATATESIQRAPGARPRKAKRAR